MLHVSILSQLAPSPRSVEELEERVGFVERLVASQRPAGNPSGREG